MFKKDVMPSIGTLPIKSVHRRYLVAQALLSKVVIRPQTTLFGVPDQCTPVLERAEHRTAQHALGQYRVSLGIEPGLKLLEYGNRSGLGCAFRSSSRRWRRLVQCRTSAAIQI